jgi:hypothetical protein
MNSDKGGVAQSWRDPIESRIYSPVSVPASTARTLAR